jgi:hypothetical protein
LAWKTSDKEACQDVVRHNVHARYHDFSSSNKTSPQRSLAQQHQ